MQMIFQDPYASLNPRYTVGEIIGEPMQIAHMGGKDEREGRVQKLLQQVGLKRITFPVIRMNFPAASASASALPGRLPSTRTFLICDEPISALDVSIQAIDIRIVQDENGLSYLFIAHDLTMVRHISTRSA